MILSVTGSGRATKMMLFSSLIAGRARLETATGRSERRDPAPIRVSAVQKEFSFVCTTGPQFKTPRDVEVDLDPPPVGEPVDRLAAAPLHA